MQLIHKYVALIPECKNSQHHFSDTKVYSINQASGFAAVLNLRYELLCFGTICC